MNNPMIDKTKPIKVHPIAMILFVANAIPHNPRQMPTIPNLIPFIGFSSIISSFLQRKMLLRQTLTSVLHSLNHLDVLNLEYHNTH